ncbi:hypothetical protein QJS10_CPB19g01880 [Acorus calamus]|uniref:N-acetyltransferase domain-containing protein n=1 Tax=Acorus calamus TaxID=4465 RepID=A0AAV9CG24_ACOCL|nr:hypothetical protein QJS10_CPB19g01880 [Acorus calamus]
MSMMAARPSDLLRVFGNRQSNRFQSRSIFASPRMENVSISSETQKKETSIPLEVQKPASIPQIYISNPSDLRFDRMQSSDEECDCRHKRVFGRFIAREAMVDEEFWTAAWLRAETHWEDRPLVRHVDNFKRKFAELEFNALKRRCTGQHGDKSTCFVAVKKEEKNVKRTVLSSIVGTLDLTIQHLLYGETFPGEHVKAKRFSNIYQSNQERYGYIANLCVAKYARRHGIASNMLYLATEAAKSFGVEKVYVHVHVDNEPAKQLYEKIGFQMVDVAMPQSLAEQKYLMCCET